MDLLTVWVTKSPKVPAGSLNWQPISLDVMHQPTEPFVILSKSDILMVRSFSRTFKKEKAILKIM